MNIWILNHYAHPPTVPGGTRHYHLARELINLGMDVTIFASSFNHVLNEETKTYSGYGPTIENIDGIRFVWIKTTPYQKNSLKRILSMISYMVKVIFYGCAWGAERWDIQKPDVVLGSSVHLLAVLAARVAAKMHQAHFLMEVRDLWPQTLIDMDVIREDSILATLLSRLEIYLYKRADKIISLLPDAWKYITPLGIDQEKIVWIPNGVDLSLFSRDYHQPEDGFSFIYLGAHGKANQLDVLLDAAYLVQDDHPEIQFQLIGDGPLKKQLIDKARQLELTNLCFQDPIPKTKVPSQLAQANATIIILPDIPLYQYGISLNKLYDYMAAARPIILMGKPSNNPVLQAECGLSIPSSEPDDLVEGILRLASLSKKELEALGRRGIEYVSRAHDYPVLGEKLFRVIIELND